MNGERGKTYGPAAPPHAERQRRLHGSDDPFVTVLSTSATTCLTTSEVRFRSNSLQRVSFDNIRLVADNQVTSTTMAYTTGNKLTKTTTASVDTNFKYDLAGRQISKYMQSGAHSATYSYRYASKLCTAVTSFPDEGDVTMAYDGLGKMRQLWKPGGVTEKYRWDGAMNRINTEDGSGNLTATAVFHPQVAAGAPLGISVGANPSTGTWGYLLQDNLGSVRTVRRQDKSLAGSYEFTPFGEEYSFNGVKAAFGFTGKPYISELGMYSFYARMYSPGQNRWTTSDPLGTQDGMNMYGYVRGNPIRYFDPMGLFLLDNLFENISQETIDIINAMIAAEHRAAAALCRAKVDTIIFGLRNLTVIGYMESRAIIEVGYNLADTAVSMLNSSPPALLTMLLSGGAGAGLGAAGTGHPLGASAGAIVGMVFGMFVSAQYDVYQKNMHIRWKEDHWEVNEDTYRNARAGLWYTFRTGMAQLTELKKQEYEHCDNCSVYMRGGASIKFCWRFIFPAMQSVSLILLAFFVSSRKRRKLFMVSEIRQSEISEAR